MKFQWLGEGWSLVLINVVLTEKLMCSEKRWRVATGALNLFP